ncbi:MAG TPA: hypothetical protein VLC46_00325 [Thermoanaerobaculia bacterium]|nr:hypothetical protein [Thermoanaerobaculia bacterium]
MLNERAGHPQIENERVLLIEKAQNRAGQAKALKNSTIVLEHWGTKGEGKHIAAFQACVQGGLWQTESLSGEASGV